MYFFAFASDLCARLQLKTLSSLHQREAAARNRNVSLRNNRTTAWCVVALWLITIGLVSLPSLGQNTSSSISGTTTDSTGAALPNAEISARNDSTGQVLSVKSDQRGSYTITNIQPGSYTVTADASGFQVETQLHQPSESRRILRCSWHDHARKRHVRADHHEGPDVLI
jgi:hypothetical protein